MEDEEDLDLPDVDDLEGEADVEVRKYMKTFVFVFVVLIN